MNIPSRIEGEGSETGQMPGKRPMIAGVQVREDDLEPQKGLHAAAFVFRLCAAIIFVLAMWQFVAWWMDPPPDGVGLGVLIGDTIRLVVFAGLLWAAGDLAALVIKTHYDIRAARILLARQTYMMRQMGMKTGDLPTADPDGNRRADDEMELSTSAGGEFRR